ncbi:MAG: ABC transporter ATP-binding protein [Ruminococcaceae bacterium]|nr:ABC transporter ATP-binding protein [Oscillospiraceae bacterium]
MRLEVKNLHKSFGEKEVLKGISFEVQSGEALGLLGRNGAGKTTTIRIIMQLFAPNEGEVLLDGKPIDIRKTNIGYMPEERGLYPKKKVIDQLIYFAELRGISKAEATNNADRLLERLYMTEYRNVKLDTLSKGNQQKIQLIATLVCNPDIVILDEPFSGLDPVNAMILKDLVKEIIAEGKLVVFSSHQMNYVEEFCKSITIINAGEVAVTGEIKKIKHSYTKNKVSVITTAPETVLNEVLKTDFVLNTVKTDDGLVIELADGATINEIMGALANSNAVFTGVTTYEPTLAEVFVDYTEDAEVVK